MVRFIFHVHPLPSTGTFFLLLPPAARRRWVTLMFSEALCHQMPYPLKVLETPAEAFSLWPAQPRCW